MEQAMSESEVRTTDAVLVVDVQRDFCPGGALPVSEGDRVVPVLNRYLDRAATVKAMAFASRDWHPPDHVSFQEQGGPWPAHCVRETDGAQFHPDLRLPPGTIVIQKGEDPNQDVYSVFEGTGFADRLRRAAVNRLWVGGLALDVCVRATVLDALKEGLEVHLIRDAVRAVEPEKAESVLQELEQAGAGVHSSQPA
jgi:nicotinamidase/pyrazinamidase